MTHPGDASGASAPPSVDLAPWEQHARWWQEGFTDGADPEYVEQIVPLACAHLAGSRRVLDVGTGEGQLARALHAAGIDVVVGVDPVSAQLVVARARAGGPHYVQAAATALPVPDASFDAVLACLVFEHLPDLDGALDEVARVLAPGGRFVMMLNHPLLQAPGSGWVVDHVLEEEYWRVGPYLPDDVSMEELAPGVVLPFVHRPLFRYVNAMAERGLLVVHVDEPAPPPGFLARAPEYGAAASIPRLLVLVAGKLDDAPTLP